MFAVKIPEELKLFTGTPGISHLNACVGINGEFTSFGDYAEGFLHGAKVLGEESEKLGANVDLLMYPMAMCFRQAIELCLKQIIVSLNNINGVDASFKMNHVLVNSWEYILSVNEKYRVTDLNPEMVKEVDAVIRELHEFDKVGMVFRYPVDRQENLSMGDTYLINLRVLRIRLTRVADQLIDWDNEIDEIKRRYNEGA